MSTEPIVTIIGTSGDPVDVINCAKFYCDKCTGFGVGPKIACSHSETESSIIMHCTAVHAVKIVRCSLINFNLPSKGVGKRESAT